jgi:hypothetical protein
MDRRRFRFLLTSVTGAPAGRVTAEAAGAPPRSG